MEDHTSENILERTDNDIYLWKSNVIETVAQLQRGNT